MTLVFCTRRSAWPEIWQGLLRIGDAKSLAPLGFAAGILWTSCHSARHRGASERRQVGIA
jgi:hypothetical protein